MARVVFYGLLRLNAGISEMRVDAPTVKALIKQLRGKIDGVSHKELKDSVIFVNGKNITSQKMFRTKLTAETEVMFLSPVCGG